MDANTIANAYLATWNETDPAARRRLLDAHWTDAATYVDPLGQASGYEQISAMIGGVQERFPGFRFQLHGRADGYAEHVRFSWMLGPEAQPDMIVGTDFVVIEGERLNAVTGFLDKVPAQA
jgi:hypothetical protein